MGIWDWINKLTRGLKVLDDEVNKKLDSLRTQVYDYAEGRDEELQKQIDELKKQLDDLKGGNKD